MTKTEIVRQRIPPGLLHCAPAPAPAARIDRQRQVARYILDLHAAGADCRAKLDAVRRLVEDSDTVEMP